jgi:hypothetical protein
MADNPPIRDIPEPPKAEKVDDEKFRVEQIVDLNNVRLVTDDGKPFYATVKDSGDLKMGDKVTIKARGRTDGVPYGASVS